MGEQEGLIRDAMNWVPGRIDPWTSTDTSREVITALQGSRTAGWHGEADGPFGGGACLEAGCTWATSMVWRAVPESAAQDVITPSRLPLASPGRGPEARHVTPEPPLFACLEHPDSSGSHVAASVLGDCSGSRVKIFVYCQITTPS